MKVLYILMRNDLPSMNCGKGMAQASHASNAFIKESEDIAEHEEAVYEWSHQTDQGFGTVLVLGANFGQIYDAVNEAREYGYFANQVTDPTYPYRTDLEIAKLISDSLDSAPRVLSDYGATLFRREVTCGYIFGEKESIEDSGFLKHLKLHP